jgi:hypothetical protein
MTWCPIRVARGWPPNVVPCMPMSAGDRSKRIKRSSSDSRRCRQRSKRSEFERQGGHRTRKRCHQQSHSPHIPTIAIDFIDLPIPTCFAISSLTRIAPMGNPFASGFAIVTISGLRYFTNAQGDKEISVSQSVKKVTGLRA